MADNLVIVESPAKAKTIEKYLGKDYVVRSSYGHIRDLSKKDLGVEVDKDFEAIYIVPDDKKKVVKELKDEVKKVSKVWLASDEDREGEAISWHLYEVLGLKKKDTKRIVFNEITKDAILHAVENPREIDINLVNAQQARRVLDRILGYKISPLLWKKVKPSLSAGRVQSVTVKLVVEREEEIKNFVSKAMFKVSALFFVPDGKSVLKATLNTKFDTKQEAKDFLEACKDSEFTVASVEKKPAKQMPAPPFTTSTLQQEASRKFGFSVLQTMTVAQQLYENGHITYMRTDSVNLSDYALNQAKDLILAEYGKDYLHTRNYTTKSKGAQEAHEAIRPTLLANKTITGDANQQKLYSLIWKRTVASQMTEAKLEKTDIKIEISKNANHFVSQAEVLLFDGFLKIYSVSVDEEDEEAREENIIPKIAQGDKLQLKTSKAAQAYNMQMPRYNEATLVKKLEDLGIGRPSTYAPTIATIQQRGYVEKRSVAAKTREIEVLTLENNAISETVEIENYGRETNKLAPTDLGIVTNKFLENNFKDIVDYGFTAGIETHFDKIAQGSEDWHKMMAEFYEPFMKELSYAEEHSGREKGERLLGKDPKTGKNVYTKIGRFGAVVQIGDNNEDTKPRFSPLRDSQSIATITLQEALELFNLPRELGEHEGEKVYASTGIFGPYVKWNGINAPLPKTADPYTITLEECITCIKEKLTKDNIRKDLPKIICTYEGKDVVLNYGRYGFYITHDERNYRTAKELAMNGLTEKDAIEIITGRKKNSSSMPPLRTFESGAEVLLGKYGEYIKYNGKNFRIPKGKDCNTLTEEDVLSIVKKK